MDNICYPLVKIFPYFIHIVFAIPKFYISWYKKNSADLTQNMKLKIKLNWIENK